MPILEEMDRLRVGMIILLTIKMGVRTIDKWRMYSRQCTSFAAFRLSNVNGFEIPAAYGNANEWGYRARREGYRVDSVPTIGSIAWSTAGGLWSCCLGFQM